MPGVMGLLLVLTLVYNPLQSKNRAVSALVKEKAREVSRAVVKGDHAKVVELTYPKVVEVMGGRNKMISTIDAIMKQMKKDGFAIKSNTIGEPSEMLTEGVNTFVVVPTTLEMTSPNGTLSSKSYLLGISPDKGKTWKFVSGSGIDNPQMRLRVLPKLPPKLKLPEKQAPVLKKND